MKEPSNHSSEEYEAWLTFHRVFRQWIWGSVLNEIASQIMYTDDPSIIWSNLRDQFKQSNETHIYQLTNDALLTFQNNDFVSVFFYKIKNSLERD